MTNDHLAKWLAVPVSLYFVRLPSSTDFHVNAFSRRIPANWSICIRKCSNRNTEAIKLLFASPHIHKLIDHKYSDEKGNNVVM